jgi:hypothetical protein
MFWRAVRYSCYSSRRPARRLDTLVRCVSKMAYSASNGDFKQAPSTIFSFHAAAKFLLVEFNYVGKNCLIKFWSFFDQIRES